MDIASTQAQVTRDLELKGGGSMSVGVTLSAQSGKTVTVDIRKSGVRDDGTAWQGTPACSVQFEI